MNYSGKKPKQTRCQIAHVKDVEFSVASEQLINNMSVMEISQPKLFSNSYTLKGSPNDLRLGIGYTDEKCETCSQRQQCQGHIGHIKLEHPVYHYGYFDQISKILSCVCHNCFKVKRPKDRESRKQFLATSQLQSNRDKLKHMYKICNKLVICHQSTQEDQRAHELFRNFKGCGYKKNPKKVIRKNYQIFWDQSGSKNIGKFMKPYSRSYVQQFLQRLSCFQQECQLLGFTTTKPINLMIKSLIVIPPQARPSLDINSQIRYEDDITRTYCKIININKSLKEKTNKLTPLQREQLIEDIEHLTASLMFKLKSSVINRNRVRNLKKRKRIQNFKTISDRLDGKQGRFRQNLMGKRVDYSARSVISPDPNLDLDQIGVPVKIARKLTFPQEINQLNYDKIINLCMIGKVKTLIQPPQQSLRNDNRVINMQKLLGEPRQEIQKYVNYGMIAERALEDGDYVILNRQPTLHRMSMMSHKVKILPYNTFRINLSVCTPYNADFDGDQMNIHVPQSYESLAQIKKISAVPKQIVAPKNSTPIMGIVQDALLGAFLFTLKDNFLNRQEVMNLLMHLQTNQYNSEFQEKLFNLPYPAIIEPQELWTGKQVMSILMPKNLTIKHIKNKSQNLSNLSDLNLIIKNGQILTGCLQKDTMGFSAGSMIHSIWLESGSKAASIFITNTQKVINNWMLQNSFSIGASDIVPKPELQTEINKQKNYLQKLYFRTLSKYMNANQVQRQNLHQRGKKILNSFQFNINTQLNSRLAKTQQIIRNNLTRLENNIFTIVQAKSKGSETNLSQIMFSVGNQNVNGMRCPLGFSKRALPHFCKDDHSPQPRGYIFSSFYSGLKPHEFFFHSMGGRQGLSDTAVKTSHVGYIQRKLVKALQDIVVKYDGTVRDSRNNLLQKFYGQDGFLPEYLQKHRIVGAQMSKQAFRKRYKWQHKQLVTVYGYGPEKIHKLRQQYSCLYYYRKRLRKIYIENQESTALQYYCPIKVDRIINKINSQSKRNTQKKYDQDQYESIGPLEIFQKVQRLINQCVPPLAQYLDKLFKSKIAVQILQDGDSMSEEQQQQKILVKGQINNTTLIKQQRSLLNATDMNLLKEHNKKKYADNFEQQLGLQVFHIHLWYNLSSRNLIKKHKITRTTFQSLLKQIKKKFHQSLAPAGQSVGALAAQSIGQPTTQMTLNTFHLAGVSQKNVTLGLPRLQQLLDISKNIKTPSMTIFPKRKIFHSERTKIQNQSYLLDYLTYYLPQRKVDDFLESSKLVYQIRKTIKKDDNQIGPLQSPWGIVLIFNWRKFSSKKYWIQIMYQIQNYIQRNVKQYYKVIEQKQFNDTVQKIQNPELLIKYMQPLSSITKQLINQQETGQNQQIAHKKSHIHTNQEDQIQCEIFNNLDKLENDIRNLSICGIKGIKSAKTSKKTILNIPKMHPLSLYANNEPLKLKSELTVFQSDGTNLRACLSHPQIDPIKTYTNDVYQISQILGIQAARQAFLNQLRDILAPYGIFINIRHLTILVDWICMRGQMSAINRYGINRAKDASICKKASYQQSTKILLQSAVFSEHDYLAGVSERILFGEAIRSGSNMFNLMLDLDKVGDYSSKAQFDKKKNLTENGYGLNLDQTPEYYSPNQSLLRANNSISRLGSLHSPDISMNFSPVNSFLNSPQIKFNSPTYIKQQKINSLSDTNSFNSLNLSSNQSPSYIQNRINSLNSTIYKSSPKYINDYSSQKINNSNPAPSPIYRTQPVLKKQISKVEQDQFQDQSYQDF